MKAVIKNRPKGNQPKTYIGAIFNDGGGIIISVDVFGAPHIKRVPPREPVIQQFIVASNLLAQAEQVESEEMRGQLNALAEQLTKKAFPGFQSWLADAGIAGGLPIGRSTSPSPQR